MVAAVLYPQEPSDTVHEATEQEGRELFEFQTRKLLGMSAEKFLAKWDAGEFRSVADEDVRRKVRRLEMLMPFVRRIEIRQASS